MRKRYKILLLLITSAICWILGYQTSKEKFLNIQTQRVNEYFGEGDMGCEINYYLKTGDSSLINF